MIKMMQVKKHLWILWLCQYFIAIVRSNNNIKDKDVTSLSPTQEVAMRKSVTADPIRRAQVNTTLPVMGTSDEHSDKLSIAYNYNPAAAVKYMYKPAVHHRPGTTDKQSVTSNKLSEPSQLTKTSKSVIAYKFKPMHLFCDDRTHIIKIKAVSSWNRAYPKDVHFSDNHDESRFTQLKEHCNGYTQCLSLYARPEHGDMEQIFYDCEPKGIVVNTSTQSVSEAMQPEGVTTMSVTGAKEATESVTEAREPQATKTATQATEAVTQATETVTRSKEPVTQAIETVTQATETVTQAIEPVTQAKEPVTQAKEPVTQAIETVTHTTEQVTQYIEPVTKAKEPVTQATKPVTKTAQPITEATLPVTGSSEPTTYEKSLKHIVKSYKHRLMHLFCDDKDYVIQIRSVSSWDRMSPNKVHLSDNHSGSRFTQLKEHCNGYSHCPSINARPEYGDMEQIFYECIPKAALLTTPIAHSSKTAITVTVIVVVVLLTIVAASALIWWKRKSNIMPRCFRWTDGSLTNGSQCKYNSLNDQARVV